MGQCKKFEDKAEIKTEVSLWPGHSGDLREIQTCSAAGGHTEQVAQVQAWLGTGQTVEKAAGVPARTWQGKACPGRPAVQCLARARSQLLTEVLPGGERSLLLATRTQARGLALECHSDHSPLG